ncbi:MAG: Ppx/GppA family phosphatase [Propionibacterium sp.]|nr:Ppx/GppA family phosphatase [Propionibacterium sp.]
MSRTVAAVDCGTNSIRLLILVSDGSTVRELTRETRLARLGQGVDATSEFHPDALARAFAVFDEYAAIITAHGDVEVRVVATSAARDVSNRSVFEDGVRARFGVDVDVISGDEEARLSSAGVLSGVDVAMPALVIDIGGGSTELITIADGGTIAHQTSLDIGAVRVRERFLPHDPPTNDEIAAARAYVHGKLDASGVDFGRIATAVGVAGTVTTFAARVLGLAEYNRAAVHELVLTRDDIVGATEHWITTPVEEIVREPTIPLLRAQVIGAGALILEAISARVPGGAVLVSETDILDGIAHSILVATTP